ncbi:MAG: SpoIIE family protein phosphatase, partial [Terracidiphilus sp.]
MRSPGNFPVLLRFSSAVFLLLTSLHAEPRATPPASVDHVVEGFGRGTIPLEGAWQFHLGDDLRWAAPDFDDAGWEQLSGDKPWGLQGHPAVTGYGWYRYHIVLRHAPGAPNEIALLIPRITDAYEVYWNGRMVGGDGRFPPHPRWYTSNQARQAAILSLGVTGSGVLAVRVWKAPLFSYDDASAGGFRELPVIGNPAGVADLRSALDFRWLSSNQFRFAEALLYLLVVLVGLFLWARNPRETLPLWMAGFALQVPVATTLSLLRLPIWGVAVVALEQPMFAIEDLCLWLLLLRLLNLSENRRLTRFVRIAAWVSLIEGVLDGILSTLPYHGWVVGTDWFLTMLVSALEFLPVVLVVWAVAARKRLSLSRWLLAFTAFLAGGINDLSIIVEQGRQYTRWSFYDRLSAPLFVVGGSAITPLTFAEALLILAVVYAVYDYSREESQRQNKLAQEIRNAQELQQVLVPEALPELPGFALTSSYRPAQEVGGDFFQVVPLASGGGMVVMGDVSGKGLPAAMTVALVIGTVRTLAEFTTSPAEMLEGLNRRLMGRLHGGFATCIALRLMPDGTGAIACAGHPPPYLNGREIQLPGAFPLGISEAKYEEIEVRLEPADHLALYTDGLLEARNEKGDLYGFERLQSQFERGLTASVALDAAVDFGQDDDITVLTLTRLQAGEESSVMEVAA